MKEKLEKFEEPIVLKKTIGLDDPAHFTLKNYLGIQKDKSIEITDTGLEKNFQKYTSKEIKDEEMVGSIEKSSAPEIISLLANYSDDAKKQKLLNNLSEEAVKEILEKVFSDFKEKRKKDEFLDLFLVSRLFLVDRLGIKDKYYYDENPITFSDKTVKALSEIYEKYKDIFSESKFMSGFGQDSQVVKPGVLLENFTQFFHRKDLDRNTRGDILDSLNYVLSFCFDDYLKRRLNQENLGDVRKDGMLLDLLKTVSDYGKYWDFSEEKSADITKAIKKIAENSQNYFIKKKARILLEHKKFSLPETYPLETEELIPIGTKRTLKEQKYLEQLIRDFQYLKSPEMQEEIEKDFSLNLNDLNSREQMCFLGVLRNKNLDEVKEINEFKKKYGLNGLRSFLASEYGEEFENSVLEVGEKLPKEKAEKIFSEYTKIVDLTQDFSEIFKKSFRLKESGLNKEIIEKFPNQIYEAILRRAKDLIFAASIILKEPEKTDLKIEDVENAFIGFEKILDILKNLNKEDSDKYDIEPEKEKEKNFFDYLIKEKETGFEYRLNIFARPKEEKTAEARINFALNLNTKNPNQKLKDIFSQDLIYPDKKIKKSQIRIGIDLDTHYREDPRYKRVLISADIGTDFYKGKRLSRTGDVLGNLLKLSSEYGHHNIVSFDEDFSKEENFSKICETLISSLEDDRKKRFKKQISK